MQPLYLAATIGLVALSGAGAGWILRGPAEDDPRLEHAEAHDSHAPRATAHAEHGKADAHPANGDNDHQPAPSGFVAVAADQLRASTIEVGRPRSAASTDAITASGQIVSAQSGRAEVAARTSGIVVRVLRQPGDQVSAGTPLATFESREIADAQSAFLQARQTEAQAEAVFAREAALFKAQVTPRADFEAARSALDAARIARTMSAQALRALGGVPAAGSGNASRHVTVRSPIAGRVMAAHVIPGAFVAPGAKLFEVADERTVWAELLVPSQDIGRVRRGQHADVTLQGDAHSHRGRVRFVSPAIDPASGTGKAIVALDNPRGELATGRLVTANIAASTSAGEALEVPRDAVQAVGGRTVVFVARAGGFEAREVTVRPGSGARVAVLSGLRPDESIALVNSFVLKAELEKGEVKHEH